MDVFNIMGLHNDPVAMKEWRTAKAYHKTDKTKAYQRAYYQKYKAKQQNATLVKRYGITLAEYTVMKEEREYKCDICGCHEDTLTKSLHIDHCHDTNEIRGLLCHSCNTGIGSLKDDPILLQTALEYLNAHSNTE